MKRFIVLQYQRVKAFYLRNERLLMPATLVGGFLVDYITFINIQIRITFAVLMAYWVLAGLTIFFIHAYDAQKISAKFKYARLFSPLVLQFFFGALLSASFVFYWFSGAFSISWPLMSILALLMLFNDVFRHYFEKPLVQIGVYFFATFSLFSAIGPFLLRTLDPWVFVIAGVASLVIFFGFIYGLALISAKVQKQKHHLFILICIIFAAMNLLYVGNIIPPIPLAVREAGMYHDLIVSREKYVMHAEPESAIKTALFGHALHVQPHERAYAYTAIFAPAEITTTIVHHWQYYDESESEWVTKDKLSFNVTGGRKEGYKGYSYKSGLAAGRWRIFVENKRGQVLGKIRFTVEQKPALTELKEVIR